MQRAHDTTNVVYCCVGRALNWISNGRKLLTPFHHHRVVVSALHYGSEEPSSSSNIDLAYG